MDITPQKLTDQELVEQTLAGNTICYETLFDRYRHPLYAAIVSRCGDEQDAATAYDIVRDDIGYRLRLTSSRGSVQDEAL